MSIRRRRRPAFEAMEDRTLLSSILVDGLEFTGTFVQSGSDNTSTGTVLIGYAPTGTEAFNPLLGTDGLVTISTAGGTTSFTIAPATGVATADLTLDSLSTNPVFWTTATTATFDIDSLTTAGQSQSLGAGTAQAVSVAGVPFDATNLAFTIPAGDDTSQAEVLLQGNLDFSSIDLMGLQVGVSGSNDVVVTSGSSASMSLSGVGTSIGDSFSAYGLTIDGQVTAELSGSTFTLSGSVDFSALDGLINIGASLSDSTNIVDGIVQEIGLELPPSFDVFGLALEDDGLTFQYALGANQDQFAMYGAATASVSGTDSITATMGTASEPGLVVDANTGDVTAVNMSISGTFSLLGLAISCPSTNPPTLVYTSNDEYEISGSVSVPTLFNATVTLGTQSQPGLTIDNGDWSVNNLQIALSDVPLGAFEIQDFEVDYTQTSSTEATVDVTLELSFPEDWDVTGSVQLGIDEATGLFDVQDVSLAWQASGADSGIPIGDTGAFLTEMSGDVQNINQPSNLIVSGTMEAVYGKQVTIFGQQASFFQVDGSFMVDKDELNLSANVLFGAVTSGGKTSGILGSGSATMVLDWDTDTYTLDANSSLLDGTFTYDATFEFDGGEILLSATANVNVPDGVPVIGGQKLGSLSFLFEYEPPSIAGGQAEGFVAAWTSVNLYVTKVNIGIEYNYETDKVIVLGSGAINALESTASSSSKTYTYSQSFSVPNGATQGTLEVDWAGNSTLSALTPTSLTVTTPGSGTPVTVTSSTTGTITLLQDTGYTTSDQDLVGIVGSTTDAYTALASGNYTLTATFTSDTAPVNPSVDASEIVDDLIANDPYTGDALVMFVSGVPSGIEVGDTVTVAGTTVSDYNTTAVVEEINSTGVVLNIPYQADASGGTLSGWDLPQFSAAWYIPPPTISVEPASSTVQTGSVEVTMPVQVASTLASNTTVDLYVALYDAQASTQTLNGTLIAQDVPLQDSTDNGNGTTSYIATATASLAGLLPTQYYFYAIVNDGTNAPVMSSPVGTDQVVENEPVISGIVSNQNGTDLSGWTVTAYEDGTEVASTTTDVNGFFAFYGGQVDYNTPVDVELTNLDPGAFSFQEPSDGTDEVIYAGAPVSADFTVTQGASIEGIAFEDQNGTGTPTGQPVLPNWTVFLDTNGDGVLEPGETWTLTNSNGAYAFYDLIPGTTYTVDLAPDTGAAAIYSFQANTVSGDSVYDIAGDPGAIGQVGTLTGGATVGSASSLGTTAPSNSTGGDNVLSLDGSTGYVSVPGTSQLQPGSGGFTVGAWINGNQTVIGADNPTIAGTITSGAASGGWNLGLSSPITLTTTSAQPSGGQYDPQFYYTADFNDDGKPDILSLNYGMQILLNTTPSGSTTPTFNDNAYSDQFDYEWEGAQAAVIADFNGDGLPDIAIDCLNLVLNTSVVLLFLNETTPGSSTLSFAVDTITLPATGNSGNESGAGIAAVTLNGTGELPDIIVSNNSDQSLTVLMNETAAGSDSPVFNAQTVTLLPSGGAVPDQIVTGDFNNDGSPDLAIAGWDGPLLVLMNTTPAGAATASFGTPAQISFPGDGEDQPSSAAVGDFNGDGEDDLAYVQWNDTGVSDTLYVLLSTTAVGSSTPTFTTQDFTVGSDPTNLLVTDLNDDGLPDIAVVNNGSNSVTVLLDTTPSDATAASFSSATYDAPAEPYFIAAGNFNGDDMPDLAVMGDGLYPLVILLNGTTAGSSSPNFTSSQYQVADSNSDSMVVAPFVDNGLDDVASTFVDGSNEITVMTTQTYLTAEVEEDPSAGSGSFSIQSPASTVLDSNTWYYVAFTYAPDVDSNGDDELTLYVNGVQVAQSIGMGTLPLSADISGAFPFDMLIGAEPGSAVSQFFSGDLADVSVWQSALSSQQVQALYQGGMMPTYAVSTPTDPTTYSNTISSATDVVAGDNFGVVESSIVTGTITNSMTGQGLSGWTVKLLDSSNQVVATTTTGSTGQYTFLTVMPGTYTIKEVLPDGWKQVSPSGNITVTVAGGAEVTGENFTDEVPPEAEGMVYTDANSDGVEDDGEVGVPGATVYIDEGDAGQFKTGDPTAVTQADGSFVFSGLAQGHDIVRILSSSIGVTTQPSAAFYRIDVSTNGVVNGLNFGLSPLVIAPIADVTVAEGSPVSFPVGLTHAESGQSTVFFLEPGAPAGATINPGTGVFAWTPTTPGTYTIGVGANAAGTPLATDSQTFTVRVTDVSPVVHLGSNTQITLGDPFTDLGSFSDPGTDPWSATVNYGDGQGPRPLLLGLDKTFELDHVYQQPGTYSVTVVVNDGEGGIGTASVEVVVPPQPVVVPPGSGHLSSGFGKRRDAFVTALYEKILGQDPDRAGLSYWSGRLRAGASHRAIERAIWDSPDHRVLQHEHLTPGISFARAYRLAMQAEAMAEMHAPASARSHKG